MKTLDQLHRDWEENAQLDPLWAICSAPGTQVNRWNIKEFFETGREQMHHVFYSLEQKGISLKHETALDFGCGVGRLTQAMAATFQCCYGVDISHNMIERAQQFNHVGERCQFVVNTHDHLQIFSENTFDFIYTFIVLQHMPPELMQKYLREFGRILRVGGIAMFQVPIKGFVQQENPFHRLPIYHPARVANKLRWETRQLLNRIFGDRNQRFYRLQKLGFSKKWLYETFRIHPPIDMHYLEESVICNLLDEMKLEIIDVIKDTHQEPGMLNGVFIVKKTKRTE